MTSHPPQECCTIGVKHTGMPTGELKTVGNTETYVARPAQAVENGILVLTDVLGHRFPNAQLIADQFAANGYVVLMPDLFGGDALSLNRPADFDFQEWLGRHGAETVEPVVEAALKEMRGEMGCKWVGGVGYCFGAKYVIRHLGSRGEDGLHVDAGFVAHPSFVSAEELRGVKGPLSIAAAETDQIFPAEKRHESEEILLGLGQPYQINLYSGVQHGFAVRGDLGNRQQTWAKEQAFLQAVMWFSEHLKR